MADASEQPRIPSARPSLLTGMHASHFPVGYRRGITASREVAERLRRYRSRRENARARLAVAIPPVPPLSQGGPDDKDPKSMKQWSLATYSQIRPERLVHDLFTSVLPIRQAENKDGAKRAVELNIAPYRMKVVMYLLSLFPEMPPHLNRDTFPNEAKKKRPSMLDVLDENYLYGLVGDLKASSYWRERRRQEVEGLEELLEELAKANLDKVDHARTREKFASNPTAAKLLHHQYKLTRIGFHEFMAMMKIRYRKACEKVLRARKHELDPHYYHPHDRLDYPNQEANVALQMLTFTETNVNSWSVRDQEDPSIVYTDKGCRILEESASDSSGDEPKELEFPACAPRIDQPGYTDAMAALSSMSESSKSVADIEREWIEMCRSQIQLWGSYYLTDGWINIPAHGQVPEQDVRIQLSEFPPDIRHGLTVEFSEVGVIPTDYHQKVAVTLAKMFHEEKSVPGSICGEYFLWWEELGLAELRCEINRKLQGRWYFLLQHLPVGQENMLHCANPCCGFHVHMWMPPGSFRLVLLERERENNNGLKPKLRGVADHPGRAADGHMWFCLTCIENIYNAGGHDIPPEVVSQLGIRSRGLLWRPPNDDIKMEWKRRLEKAIQANSGLSGSESGAEKSVTASHEPEATKPPKASISGVERDLEHPPISPFLRSQVYRMQPGRGPYPHNTPNMSSTQGRSNELNPSASSCVLFFEAFLHYRSKLDQRSQAIAPGLSPFSAKLSSFIKPDIRTNNHKLDALNSYECSALMKWKNMCTRKTMWEIPSNRAFCSQIFGIQERYDFVNFFGKDVLDQDQPESSIVEEKVLEAEPVSADDISTIMDCGSADDTSELDSETIYIREVKPLSEIMKLIDKRVEETLHHRLEVPSEQPVKPTHPLGTEYVQDRTKEQKEEDQWRIIRENQETIRRLGKAKKL